MRISDWSSDVCSSDLRLEAGRREVGAAVIAEIGERHDTDVDPVAERLEDAGGGRTDTIAAGLVNHGSGAERPGDGLRQRRQFRVLELRRQEIGRASCRERVCRTCRSRWSPDHSKKKTPSFEK